MFQIFRTNCLIKSITIIFIFNLYFYVDLFDSPLAAKLKLSLISLRNSLAVYDATELLVCFFII